MDEWKNLGLDFFKIRDICYSKQEDDKKQRTEVVGEADRVMNDEGSIGTTTSLRNARRFLRRRKSGTRYIVYDKDRGGHWSKDCIDY